MLEPLYRPAGGVCEARHLLWPFCDLNAPSGETSPAWIDARTPLRTKTTEEESVCSLEEGRDERVMKRKRRLAARRSSSRDVRILRVLHRLMETSGSSSTTCQVELTRGAWNTASGGPANMLPLAHSKASACCPFAPPTVRLPHPPPVGSAHHLFAHCLFAQPTICLLRPLPVCSAHCLL